VDERADDLPYLAMDRRRFLTVAGASALLMGVDPVVARATGGVPLLGPVTMQDATTTLTAVLRRRADMVRLRFAFTNVVVDRSGEVPVLRPATPGIDGGVVVTFPPQSMLEQALPFPASVPSPGSLGARLSRESRVSFTIPAAVLQAGIPYTSDGLLDWRDWSLRVPRGALDNTRTR
jgi:hypothetical protein